MSIDNKYHDETRLADVRIDVGNPAYSDDPKRLAEHVEYLLDLVERRDNELARLKEQVARLLSPFDE